KVLKAEQATAREVLSERERGIEGSRPWEETIKKRREHERAAFLHQAGMLRRLAAQQNPVTRAAMTQAAGDLEEFARSLPEPKTLRETLRDQLTQREPQKQPPSQEHER